MNYENLILEKEGGIGSITMNRPKVANALNTPILEELYSALEEMENDGEVGVIILKGAGNHFSAGHDLKEVLKSSLMEARDIFGKSVKVWKFIASMGKPVIAAVQGYATAAGCGLAAACDLVVASKDARFQTPGASIGFFCMTPMVPLFRSVGMKNALEMLLTSRPIDAEEAHKIGLVNRVVPEGRLEEGAYELAKEIRDKSWVAIQMGKPAFYTMFDMGYGEALEYARDLISMAATTEDAKEGMNAVLEKRSPEWEWMKKIKNTRKDGGEK
jgi:enoyl-CoA hydratase/carnithine racemase